MRLNQARMPSDDDPLLSEVTALSRKVARPLVWHDLRESWPKRLLGGSFFILRYDVGLIGVTAEHVVTKGSVSGAPVERDRRRALRPHGKRDR